MCVSVSGCEQCLQSDPKPVLSSLCGQPSRTRRTFVRKRRTIILYSSSWVVVGRVLSWHTASAQHRNLVKVHVLGPLARKLREYQVGVRHSACR